jgi:hypothetical protein|uniref:Uncharacterized protein n=1 Tax=uncultured marine virus TaxID=186617 RepID=A0A0F7L0M5_9VIRU|nr:hypothetical protein [uncultured marine virus]
MKVRFEVERTFPLEQFGNIKPRIVLEDEVVTEAERANFFQTAEGFALERLSIFKKRLQ